MVQIFADECGDVHQRHVLEMRDSEAQCALDYMNAVSQLLSYCIFYSSCSRLAALEISGPASFYVAPNYATSVVHETLSHLQPTTVLLIPHRGDLHRER